MKVFGSNASPPVLAKQPQSRVGILSKDTAEMITVTQTANRLATETFFALECAQQLKKSSKLSPDQRQQVSAAKQLLKAQHVAASNTVYELRCFNKTYDQVAQKLDKLSKTATSWDSKVVNPDRLVTKEGYTTQWLHNEVVRHRSFVVDLARHGVHDVQNAITQLHEVGSETGLAPPKVIAESWRAIASGRIG
jgi:hypothetical protein